MIALQKCSEEQHTGHSILLMSMSLALMAHIETTIRTIDVNVPPCCCYTCLGLV